MSDETPKNKKALLFESVIDEIVSANTNFQLIKEIKKRVKKYQPVKEVVIPAKMGPQEVLDKIEELNSSGAIFSWKYPNFKKYHEVHLLTKKNPFLQPKAKRASLSGAGRDSFGCKLGSQAAVINSHVPVMPPGDSVSHIASLAGLNVTRVSGHLKKMVSLGKVQRSGNLYYV